MKRAALILISAALAAIPLVFIDTHSVRPITAVNEAVVLERTEETAQIAVDRSAMNHSVSDPSGPAEAAGAFCGPGGFACREPHSPGRTCIAHTCCRTVAAPQSRNNGRPQNPVQCRQTTPLLLRSQRPRLHLQKQHRLPLQSLPPGSFRSQRRRRYSGLQYPAGNVRSVDQLTACTERLQIGIGRMVCLMPEGPSRSAPSA